MEEEGDIYMVLGFWGILPLLFCVMTIGFILM